jgi:dienelactone hydrolase
MTNWFTVEVNNITFENKNGLKVRGKLFRPPNASEVTLAPGVVYLHGYQNNRETSDPYAIELARCGFVAITLDALGRGNSENQFSEDEPGFDPTYGADSAFEYLQSLPYVDADRCGLGGYSLGAEMSYLAAMENPEVRAIVVSGFAYTEDATPNRPQNMLMIFGKYIEHMIILLALMIPLGSFLYEATGNIYPGAILNALIVTWMFTSSSVIAPLPV